ncbi:oxygenase MpaB family protein [Streptomyces sp. NPDC001868]|uniref:oxygenase MpaB family protein n=1 Tax=Streptomyces sp. NPDC001868 TaxID=3154401 RepID=UPI00332531A8
MARGCRPAGPDAARHQAYRLWWYLGHLLGVSPEFYRRVRSQQDAADLLELLDATNPPATEQGAQLANWRYSTPGTHPDCGQPAVMTPWPTRCSCPTTASCR